MKNMAKKYISQGQLSIASELLDFVNNELLPGTNITKENFWSGLDKSAHELTPKNRKLLEFRENLQKKIDNWHRDRKGEKIDIKEYSNFLVNIGYLNKEEGKFQILNWDLDVEGYEPPEVVMIPRGSNGYMRSYSVVPGNYEVKFTYGDYEKISSFKILADPRENISKEHYDNKNELLSKIDSDIDNIYSSLIKFQSVRNQLKDLNERLGENEIYNEIVDLSKSTIELINDTESKLISPKQKTFQDVINFRNQLDNQLYDLMMTIDQNFPPLTGGEKIRYNDLHARWVSIKTGVDKVVENVDGINTLLTQKSVPYISREKK